MSDRPTDSARVSAEAGPTAAPADGRNTSKAYELEKQIGYLLRRAHQRTTAIFMANIAELNLTPTQLAALAKVADEGKVTQNRLGRLTAMDPATMQGVIKRLSERGYVDRRPDPHDRRRTVLTLTADGRALLERAAPASVKTSAETLAPLTPRQQAQFLDLLQKLT